MYKYMLTFDSLDGVHKRYHIRIAKTNAVVEVLPYLMSYDDALARLNDINYVVEDDRTQQGNEVTLSIVYTTA